MSLYANEDGILKEISALDSGFFTIQGIDFIKTFNIAAYSTSKTITLSKAISAYKFIIVLYRGDDATDCAVPVILEITESFCNGSSVVLGCSVNNSNKYINGQMKFKRTDDYTISLDGSGNLARGDYGVYGVF